MQDSHAYDRSLEDLGNIVQLEHVNLDMPDQRLATAFFVSGLQATRDPYMQTGLDNMWINIGRSQIHLPSRKPRPQRLRGTIGLVVPDLDAVARSLDAVAPRLAGTQFAMVRQAQALLVTCPWGNRYRCHAPSEAFGRMALGVGYVELDVPLGSASGIAAFYDSIFSAKATTVVEGSVPTAVVAAGHGQSLHFRETDVPQPAFDGHHVAIYIADFSGPHRRLIDRGLLSREVDQHEWRFEKIVDLTTGALLFELEHEVRSMTHPLFARPLINRNPGQGNPYRPGQDAFRGS